ncbi:non-heme iron oxygenase ferredoxin subunit [Marinomonas primoryensis]|uniref:Non-heme iron oxygenase ferredoxin subunit n=1 Tax=Marinomonas primoryensis TaxID=178399 RepID=A0A859CZD5_9GAMM|nr:non-heme iron oxygenase ferredoxin subunit [Marinomonas primoryensis]QKK81884.1 non-heme iron oxygenase ferredoxin subunit [Marinomonas primoryensis]
MTRLFLCNVSDVPDNTVRKIDNAEHGDIAVYNLGGQFYATADLCSHATASLAEGDIEDDLIVCPVHWGTFHIPTGEARGFPCEINIHTYPIEQEGDDVFALIVDKVIDPNLIAKG